MTPAISVRGLGKSYRITHQAAKKYRTLRDDLTEWTRRVASGDWRRESGETFWALRDIDFDIAPGEIVGVIGRNGAGKSTLLKILSRITPPTTGEAVIEGRIGSLLEVGTGFHPELSGRENIYLSGAILGMKRREVAAKFDEIVAFAEIEKFLDTPAKRYSSGMYVRLAFAVAAHLETEILLVDEVLAVGDAKFQEKCIGKLGEVRSTGRTVLFVSHNMGLINQLCTSALFLRNGSPMPCGSKQEAISLYLESDRVSSGETFFEPTHPFLGLKSVRIAQAGLTTSRVKSSLPFEIVLEIVCSGIYSRDLICGFTLIDELGMRFLSTYFNDLNDKKMERSLEGNFTVTCPIPPHVLNEGRFVLDIDLGLANTIRVTDPLIHSVPLFVENIDGVGSHIGMGKQWRSTPSLPYYDWNLRS